MTESHPIEHQNSGIRRSIDLIDSRQAALHFIHWALWWDYFCPGASWNLEIGPLNPCFSWWFQSNIWSLLETWVEKKGKKRNVIDKQATNLVIVLYRLSKIYGDAPIIILNAHEIGIYFKNIYRTIRKWVEDCLICTLMHHQVPIQPERHQNFTDRTWEQALCTLVYGQQHKRKFEAVYKPKTMHQELLFNSYMPKYGTHNTGGNLLT